MIAREIEQRVPAVVAAFFDIDAALQMWFPTTNTPFGFSPAQHVSSSLASNDFLDLLGDLLDGRGRSAIRSMRSLFEHLIAVEDVTADPALGARFLEHRAVVEQVAAGLTFEVEALAGKERKAEEHRLRKLRRESQSAAETAVTAYGPGYRRGWSDQDLRSRARSHGFGADYEVYRLTSSVLHGSAGGAVGTIRQDGVEGRAVHRLGPALALCSLAYLRGLTYYRVIVETLVESNDRRDVADRAAALLAAIRAALALWPEYRRAVMDLDEQLWDSALPVSTLMTVLALERDGTASWWLWDLTTRVVAQVTPPDIDVARAALAACRAQLQVFTEVFWEHRRHASFVITNVALTPKDPVWYDSANLVHDERPEAVYGPDEPMRMVEKEQFAPSPVLQALIQGGVPPMR